MDYGIFNYTFFGKKPTLVETIIFITFLTLALLANFSIVYAILRIKKIRSLPNVLLANWAIADLCNIFAAMIGYRAIRNYDDTIEASTQVLCSLRNFGYVLHFNIILFALILVIDWTVAVYFSKISKAFRSYCTYIVGTIWLNSLFCFGCATFVCFACVDNNILESLLIISFFLLVITATVLQTLIIMRKKRVDYPNAMVTLATALVVLWFLAFIASQIRDYQDYPMKAIIAECLKFLSPLVNYIILYVSNEDFRTCIQQRYGGFNSKEPDRYIKFCSENRVYQNTTVGKI